VVENYLNKKSEFWIVDMEIACEYRDAPLGHGWSPTLSMFDLPAVKISVCQNQMISDRIRFGFATQTA
jgi:hypothetical protein